MITKLGLVFSGLLVSASLLVAGPVHWNIAVQGKPSISKADGCTPGSYEQSNTHVVCEGGNNDRYSFVVGSSYKGRFFSCTVVGKNNCYMKARWGIPPVKEVCDREQRVERGPCSISGVNNNTFKLNSHYAPPEIPRDPTFPDNPFRPRKK